jgi:hypothetical protein
MSLLIVIPDGVDKGLINIKPADANALAAGNLFFSPMGPELAP